MNTEYMTKKELRIAVDAFVKKANVKDQKWLYCYFTEMEEWPLITDEVKEPLVSGQGAWTGGEEVPF